MTFLRKTALLAALALATNFAGAADAVSVVAPAASQAAAAAPMPASAPPLLPVAAPPAAPTPVVTAAPAAVPAAAPGYAIPTTENAILMTVFLRHDQSRPLSELNAQLAKQGFYKQFPPPGVEVVTWVVAMGIGQIITLRLPATRVREVNRVLEDTAWGAYRTDFYPTYDYRSIGLGEHEKAQ